jgi:hypothetical protein
LYRRYRGNKANINIVLKIETIAPPKPLNFNTLFSENILTISAISANPKVTLPTHPKITNKIIYRIELPNIVPVADLKKFVEIRTEAPKPSKQKNQITE